MSAEMIPNETPAWEYETQIFDGSWHSVVTREHPDILGNTYRNLQPLTADRSTRPAEPAAPVAEAVDGEVALKSLLAAIQLGHAAYDADESSSDLSAFREAYGAHNAIEQLLANLRSTLEAERARADAAEQRAADALARAEKAEDWQPIETAPRDGTIFLGFAKGTAGTGRFWISQCKWVGPSERHPGSSLDWYMWQDGWPQPTHWRPLPFPPRASREAQPATDGEAA